MTTEELIHKITGVCFEAKSAKLSITSASELYVVGLNDGRCDVADDIIELLEEFSKPERKE